MEINEYSNTTVYLMIHLFNPTPQYDASVVVRVRASGGCCGLCFFWVHIWLPVQPGDGSFPGDLPLFLPPILSRFNAVLHLRRPLRPPVRSDLRSKAEVDYSFDWLPGWFAAPCYIIPGPVVFVLHSLQFPGIPRVLRGRLREDEGEGRENARKRRGEAREGREGRWGGGRVVIVFVGVFNENWIIFVQNGNCLTWPILWNMSLVLYSSCFNQEYIELSVPFF